VRSRLSVCERFVVARASALATDRGSWLSTQPPNYPRTFCTTSLTEPPLFKSTRLVPLALSSGGAAASIIECGVRRGGERSERAWAGGVGRCCFFCVDDMERIRWRGLTRCVEKGSRGACCCPLPFPQPSVCFGRVFGSFLSGWLWFGCWSARRTPFFLHGYSYYTGYIKPPIHSKTTY